MKVFIATVLAVLALSIFAIRITKSVSMKQNCTGYLKRAADANTVETAKEQLQKSIQYLVYCFAFPAPSMPILPPSISIPYGGSTIAKSKYLSG